MALSKEYLDYLDDHIEMAPANSQEELDAAQTLLGLFEDHGLSSFMQEFDAPPDTKLFRGILMVLMFVAMIIAGIGGVGLAVLGLFLFLVGFVIVFLGFNGNDLLSRLLAPARSQNVVAVHRGEGPESGRGVRPIVVLAHYDTGREDLLSSPAISPFAHLVFQAFPVTSVASLVCAFLQLFVVMPEPVLRVLWVVGILCALPALIWGINDVASRFMPPTGAANDNNSSLAALLGVMEDVAPVNPPYLEEYLQLNQPAPVVETPTMVEEASGTTRTVVEETVVEEDDDAVRHGADVIHAMGILPASCEITYTRRAPKVVHRVVEVPVEQAPVVSPEPVAAEEVTVSDPDTTQTTEAVVAAPAAEPMVEDTAAFRPSVGEPTPRSARMAPAAPVEAVEADEADVVEEAPSDDDYGEGGGLKLPSFARMIHSFGHRGDTVEESRVEETVEEPAAAEPVAEETVTEEAAVAAPVHETADPSSTADLNADAQGTAAMEVVDVQEGEEPLEAGSTMAMPAMSQVAQVASVDDPTWGTSTYTPGNPADIARRAALFDLPDPSVAAVDPLSSTFDTGPSMAINPADFPEEDFDSDVLYEADPQTSVQTPKPIPQVRAVETHTYTRATDRNGRVSVHTTRKTRVSTVRGQAKGDGSIKVQPLSVENPAAPAQPTDEAKPAHRSLKDRLHIPGRKKEQEESMSQWLGVDEDFDARTDGESIGSWDNFDEDDDWKGGATRSAETRDGDQADDAELTEAVLAMDQAKLLAHDIWFVAAGASELDHTGAKEFMDTHKKELRGAFLVNLDCVGAGELTVLTAEGAVQSRRVDRRILKMLTRIAKDLHIPLRERPMTWTETDATAAMRRSVRSATLVGLDPGDMRALAHTAQNIPQNVDADQVVDVNHIVSELIRRA